MVEEMAPKRLDAYRLERIEQDGVAAPIAIFYSAGEALIIVPSLSERYRLMLGERQVWPKELQSTVTAAMRISDD